MSTWSDLDHVQSFFCALPTFFEGKLTIFFTVSFSACPETPDASAALNFGEITIFHNLQSRAATRRCEYTYIESTPGALLVGHINDSRIFLTGGMALKKKTEKMARPVVPSKVHRAVKLYAVKHGIFVPEAYARLFKDIVEEE